MPQRELHTFFWAIHRGLPCVCLMPDARCGPLHSLNDTMLCYLWW